MIRLADMRKRLVGLKRNFWSYCAVLLFARALENGLSKDSELKANRLHLLAPLRDLFIDVADVSVLQG